MKVVKLYWWIRALLRFGVFNKEPSVEEISGWIFITRLVTGSPRTPEKFRCGQCGRWAWRLGRTTVCDRYGCYVASKMGKRAEVAR